MYLNSSLEFEGEAEAGFECTKQLRGQGADSLGESIAIDRQQLRNLDNAILGQAGGASRAEDVPRRLSACEIRSHCGDDRGAEPGAVERIGLDDRRRCHPISKEDTPDTRCQRTRLVSVLTVDGKKTALHTARRSPG